MAFGALWRPPIGITQIYRLNGKSIPIIILNELKMVIRIRALPVDSDVDSITPWPGNLFKSQLGYG